MQRLARMLRKSISARGNESIAYKRYLLLLHLCLRYSPSYVLAHKVKRKKLKYPGSGQVVFPADFGRVLKTYEALGDVFNTTSEEWRKHTLTSRSMDAGVVPSISALGVYDPRAVKPGEDHIAALKDYLKAEWRRQGRPTFINLAVPITIRTDDAARQIRRILRQHRARSFANRKAEVARPFEFARPKVRWSTLVRYMLVYITKLDRHEDPLWKVGARAELCMSYSLNADRDIGSKKRDEKNAMAVLTHRALKNFNLICENAARGLFPSYRPNRNAIAFDWNASKRLAAWQSRRDKALYQSNGSRMPQKMSGSKAT
jgi:hypothetical protein